MKLALAAKFQEKKTYKKFRIYITICLKVATFPYTFIYSPFHQILVSLRIVFNVHNQKKKSELFTIFACLLFYMNERFHSVLNDLAHLIFFISKVLQKVTKSFNHSKQCRYFRDSAFYDILFYCEINF